MADHGMLFVDTLALEILEGRKVETRRPITRHNSMPVAFWSEAAGGTAGFDQLDWAAHLVPADGQVAPSGSTPCTGRCTGRDYCCTFIDGLADENGEYLHVPGVGGETRQRVMCRVVPGDNLWVREAWRVIPTDTGQASVPIAYRAGGNAKVPRPDDVGATELAKWSRVAKSGAPRWTPSLLQPRWAARSVRKVLTVRAERLAPLTDTQAIDEGFGSSAEFSAAWDAIYGPKGMAIADRPWVWVIRFADRSE